MYQCLSFSPYQTHHAHHGLQFSKLKDKLIPTKEEREARKLRNAQELQAELQRLGSSLGAGGGGSGSGNIAPVQPWPYSR